MNTISTHKESMTEDIGVSLLKADDLNVFSPGISTEGWAEIRMMKENSDRKIYATTLDEPGLEATQNKIIELGLEKNIEAKLEDLRENINKPENYFDYIYARLVLQYLNNQEINSTLKELKRVLKPNKLFYSVVHSDSYINTFEGSKDITFHEKTGMTDIPMYFEDGSFRRTYTRRWYNLDEYKKLLESHGFEIVEIKEVQELLYYGYTRETAHTNMSTLIYAVVRNKK